MPLLLLFYFVGFAFPFLAPLYKKGSSILLHFKISFWSNQKQWLIHLRILQFSSPFFYWPSPSPSLSPNLSSE
ncbi:hypothetical protein glysoja_013763 [Glycine soja]|nr:hypothetical protein glysoja_013763 [Glycine soja]